MSRRLVALAASTLLAAFGTPALADTVGFVRGTLTLDGRPVAAHVTLAGGSLVLGADAKGDGGFAFSRVPFGDYHMAAKMGDGRTAPPIEISVGSDEVTNVALAVTTEARVIGRVSATSRGASGTPVSQNIAQRRFN